jgi:hypothetical protein
MRSCQERYRPFESGLLHRNQGAGIVRQNERRQYVEDGWSIPEIQLCAKGTRA